MPSGLKLIYRLFGTLAVTSLICACGKEKPEPVGSLSGQVRVLNEFGQSVADRAGVTVTASQGTTQTNANGQFALPTAAGTHTITFEKAYLGTYKLVGQPVRGAVTLPLITLGTQPVRGVSGIVLRLESSSIQIEGLMADANPPGLPPRKHRLFLHAGPVSPRVYSLSTGGDTNVGIDQFFDVITFDQLRTAGLMPGQAIQVRAYGENVFAETYTDPDTNRRVYPGLSDFGSNVVTFTY